MRLSGRRMALLAVVVGFSACSGITTSADYDRAVDFSSFKTYAWKDVEPSQNALLEGRIQRAVDATLASKGLRRVDDSPDLWVVEHTRLTREIRIDTYNAGWGYGWGWRRGPGVAAISEIPVGNLFIDLVDANRRQLVWRATASKTLDPGASPETRERNINEAVRKMFAAYPPAK